MRVNCNTMKLIAKVSRTVEPLAMYTVALMLLLMSSCVSEDSSQGEEISAESGELSNLVINDASKEVLMEMEEAAPACASELAGNYVNSSTPGEQSNSTSSSESAEEDRSLASYPYVASLQRRDAHYASGALVHPRWVLTAAAHFYNVRESIKLFRAHLGSVDCKRGVAIPLARVEVHPAFEPGKAALDLALLQLASAAVLSALVQPIALSGVTDKVISAKFLSAYWPTLIINGQVLPASAKERVQHTSLRISTQMLIPWDKCAVKLHQLGHKLPITSLCLKPITKFHSVCMPDVGAPVVAEDGLWGVTSAWRPQPCPPSAPPALFTRLALPAAHSWLIALLH